MTTDTTPIPEPEFGYPLIWKKNPNVANYKLWFESGAVLNGQVIFHPTEDGTADGKALFGFIEDILYGAQYDVIVPTDVVSANTKEISADKKTITVTAMQNGGWALDGTVISIGIKGY